MYPKGVQQLSIVLFNKSNLQVTGLNREPATNEIKVSLTNVDSIIKQRSKLVKVVKTNEAGEKLYLLPQPQVGLESVKMETIKQVEVTDTPCMVTKTRQIPVYGEDGVTQLSYEVTTQLQHEDGSTETIGTGRFIFCTTTEEYEEQEELNGEKLYWKEVSVTTVEYGAQPPLEITESDEGWTDELEPVMVDEELVETVKLSENPEEFSYEDLDDDRKIVLSALKQDKINVLWVECNKDIEGGFYSDATGTDHLYGFDSQDRENLLGTLSLMNSNPNMTYVPWKPKGVAPFPHTREQFISICNDAFSHKQSKINRYWLLRDLIASMTLPEDINNVGW